MFGWHPATSIFPALSETELQALEENIRRRGVREPVEVLHGLIIDGRARYTVCKRLGKDCPTRDVHTPDPVAYVIGKNIHRKVYSTGALSILAAKARAEYTRVGEVLPNIRERCGNLVGVSGQSVDLARVVLSTGVQELQDAVFNGKIRLNPASQIAKLPEEDQRAIIQSDDIEESYKAYKRAKSSAPLTRNGKTPVGVMLGNEALNVLMRIPRSDPLRERGFQIVADWIRKNK